MQSHLTTDVVKSPAPGALIAWATFAPANTASAQTLVEAFGITQIIRTSGAQAGRWTCTLKDKHPAFDVFVQETEDDTTLYHFLRCESKSESAGTFVVSHRSVAFASVASGPTLSDTCDLIKVFVFARAL